MRNIEDILMDYMAGETLSQEEQEELISWLEIPGNRQRFDQLQTIRRLARSTYMCDSTDYDRLWNKIHDRTSSRRSVTRFFKQAALFILPLTTALCLYFLQEHKSSDEKTLLSASEGQPNICLVLSSGEKKNLSRTTDTLIDETAGLQIHHLRNKLNYQAAPSPTLSQVIYNTLQIPRGAEFQLILQDGTKVWLNAESEIRYPLTFVEKERKVYLKGEAFFEVAPDSLHPFIVISEKAVATVLGTKFNFRSYEKEICHITLTAGRLQVVHRQQPQARCILSPGDNAQIDQDLRLQKNIDTAPYVSWHNGYFCFKEEKLENILHTLERWYNFNTLYVNPQVKAYTFTAWFNRNDTFENILHQLEQTNKIKILIQDQTVSIYDAERNRETAPTVSR